MSEKYYISEYNEPNEYSDVEKISRKSGTEYNRFFDFDKNDEKNTMHDKYFSTSWEMNIFNKNISKIEIFKSFNNNNIAVTPIYKDEGAVIKVEDLPDLALPVIEFIEDKKPDVVIAADRGGRYFGLAVYKTWKKVFPDKPFPTIDGNLHFGRLTKKELTDDEIKGIAADAIERSIRLARDGYEGIRDGILRVMLIDDWICAGSTRERLLKAFESLGYVEGSNLELYTGVMCGRHASVSGSQSRGKYCEWQDNDELAGVIYKAGSPHPQSVMTKGAKKLRARLDASVDKIDVSQKTLP